MEARLKIYVDNEYYQIFHKKTLIKTEFVDENSYTKDLVFKSKIPK